MRLPQETGLGLRERLIQILIIVTNCTTQMIQMAQFYTAIPSSVFGV